jgi:hypothetical protein
MKVSSLFFILTDFGFKSRMAVLLFITLLSGHNLSLLAQDETDNNIGRDILKRLNQNLPSPDEQPTHNDEQLTPNKKNRAETETILDSGILFDRFLYGNYSFPIISGYKGGYYCDVAKSDQSSSVIFQEIWDLGFLEYYKKYRISGTIKDGTNRPCTFEEFFGILASDLNESFNDLLMRIFFNPGSERRDSWFYDIKQVSGLDLTLPEAYRISPISRKPLLAELPTLAKTITGEQLCFGSNHHFHGYDGEHLFGFLPHVPLGLTENQKMFLAPNIAKFAPDSSPDVVSDINDFLRDLIENHGSRRTTNGFLSIYKDSKDFGEKALFNLSLDRGFGYGTITDDDIELIKSLELSYTIVADKINKAGEELSNALKSFQDETIANSLLLNKTKYLDSDLDVLGTEINFSAKGGLTAFKGGIDKSSFIELGGITINERGFWARSALVNGINVTVLLDREKSYSKVAGMNLSNMSDSKFYLCFDSSSYEKMPFFVKLIIEGSIINKVYGYRDLWR